MSFLYLALSLVSSAATSADYLLFWGVKGARFAADRGISDAFLRHPFSIHAVPDYPPLVPVLQAWGCLVAGRMPWRFVPAFSGVWLLAAVPILFDRGRRRLGDEGSAALVTCWVASMCASLPYSFSGGNAEVPVLFFESVALGWLLTEGEVAESRLVPSIALCGAALTKVEGLLAVVLIAAGVFLRDRGEPRRRPLTRSLALVAWPLAAVGVWFVYQRSRAMPVGYRPHGELFALYTGNLAVVLRAMLESMTAGSLWLSWLFALFFLTRSVPAWKRAAPALTLASGLILFFVFDYLHDRDDPSERIGWTTPRVTQPALSAAILGAGVLSLGPGRSRRAPAAPP
jgi:hypothetical protein